MAISFWSSRSLGLMSLVNSREWFLKYFWNLGMMLSGIFFFLEILYFVFLLSCYHTMLSVIIEFLFYIAAVIYLYLF